MVRFLRLSALALVLVVGVACGGGAGNGSSAGPADDGGGATTLTTANFAFAPASVTATTGDTIELTNEDDAKHNLTAEDAGLDVDVDAGATATVDLSGVEAGSYDFYCEYHKDSMTGTLEVTG